MRTDENLRVERERSDDELLARSTALAEDAEEVIERARERARLVLELARDREDQHLFDIGATAEVRGTVQDERRTADAALADERATAQTQRLDERERRRAAMIQLLAFERSATDRTLSEERRHADDKVFSRQDLLGLVAHDMRNMLTTIAMNASVLVMAPELQMTAAPAAHIQRVSSRKRAGPREGLPSGRASRQASYPSASPTSTSCRSFAMPSKSTSRWRRRMVSHSRCKPIRPR